MTTGHRPLDERTASTTQDVVEASTVEDISASGKSITIDLRLASLVVGAVGVVFVVMLGLFSHLNDELEKTRAGVNGLTAEQSRQGEDLKRLRELLDDRERQLKERIDFIANPLRVRLDTLEAKVAAPLVTQSASAPSGMP